MGSKDKIQISFCGENASEVTGSCIWIKTPDTQILLECGLYQTAGNTLSAYKINNEHFKFKPRDIDYVFVMHTHTDHIGLTPRIYKYGSNARTIMPTGSKAITDILLRDSANIMISEAAELSKEFKRDYPPTYTIDNVEQCLSHIDEYDMGKIVQLNDFIKFRFVSSGHILNSAQLELWITCNNITQKILYTSDLGNVHIKKCYVNDFVAVDKANIVIGETTYGGENRISTQKIRNKDIEKLRSTIEDVCKNNRGRVLIPVFAQDRLQHILTHLFDLFGNDRSFNIPVLVDTPMGIRIGEAYKTLLPDKELNKWEHVIQWENIMPIIDPDESKAWQNDSSPAVILSSSGMLTGGRSRAWCKALLPDSRNTIIFCGFSVDNSLASIIKTGKVKTIKIGGKRVANRCRVVDLHSFSSHMQKDSLLSYYSNINCEKIFLVHGEMDGKNEFVKELEDAISKNDRTTKVVCVNKNYTINI